MFRLWCSKSVSEEAADNISVQHIYLGRRQSVQELHLPDLLGRRRLHILGLLPTLIPCHRMG